MPFTPNPDRLAYIAKHKEAMIEVSRYSRLLPSVMMAQGVLESNNGKSTLTAKYHNHFGIKAQRGYKGKMVNMRTGEVFNGQSVMINDNFRAYDSDLEGFKDRVNFLYQNQRYKNVFGLQRYQDQAQALKDAGYATDPDYAQKLIRVIEDYKLYELDTIQRKKNVLAFVIVIASVIAIGFFFWWKGWLKK